MNGGSLSVTQSLLASTAILVLSGVTAAQPLTLAQQLLRPVDLRDGVASTTPLHDALEFLADRHDWQIAIDRAAFRAKGVVGVDGRPIRLPRMVGTRLDFVLLVLLDQVDSTYQCQGELLVVVPPAKAIPLVERLPAGRFEVELKVRERLKRPVTNHDGVAAKTPLKEALEALDERHDLPFLIDHSAFRVAGKPDVLARPVRLPPWLDVPLDMVLPLLLGQVQGTYAVRDGIVLVTPVKK